MAYTNASLVTIITVTYNSEAFIGATIDSVLAQTAGNIQYIIGDDCSTDKTWDIVSEYTDPRIVRYRNPVNLREYPNRSKALGMACGKYVIYIDGDDIVYPHAIETFLWYAERFPECATFYSRDWDNRILCPYKLQPENIFQFEYLDLGIIGGSFANVFFDTAVLKTFGLPLNIQTGDSYIQLKIGQQYPALVIPGSLAWWRQRSGNATEVFFSDYRNYAEVIKYRLDLLNEGCPLNLPEQAWAKKKYLWRHFAHYCKAFF